MRLSYVQWLIVVLALIVIHSVIEIVRVTMSNAKPVNTIKQNIAWIIQLVNIQIVNVRNL
jgi:hypothetical protein